MLLQNEGLSLCIYKYIGIIQEYILAIRFLTGLVIHINKFWKILKTNSSWDTELVHPRHVPCKHVRGERGGDVYIFCNSPYSAFCQARDEHIKDSVLPEPVGLSIIVLDMWRRPRITCSGTWEKLLDNRKSMAKRPKLVVF